jgi:hypothetical protein
MPCCSPERLPSEQNRARLGSASMAGHFGPLLRCLGIEAGDEPLWRCQRNNRIFRRMRRRAFGFSVQARAQIGEGRTGISGTDRAKGWLQVSVLLQQSFEIQHCCTCGVAFAIPSDLERVLRATHRDFFCPNGHVMIYSHETEAERLRTLLAATKKELAEECQRTADALNDLMLIENQASRCSQCNRSFQDLARHIKAKHGKALPVGSGQRLLLGAK